MKRPPPARLPLNRMLLIALIAVSGMVIASQTRAIVERFGLPTYLVLVAMLACLLAGLAVGPRRRA